MRDRYVYQNARGVVEVRRWSLAPIMDEEDTPTHPSRSQTLAPFSAHDDNQHLAPDYSQPCESRRTIRWGALCWFNLLPTISTTITGPTLRTAKESSQHQANNPHMLPEHPMYLCKSLRQNAMQCYVKP